MILRLQRVCVSAAQCKHSRWLSSNIKFDAGDSEVEEVISENLDKSHRRDDSPARVLTTHRESISLYREIVRYTNLFVWTNEVGRSWRDVLRESARQEFEAAKHETDPEIINRLLVVGRDSVQQVKDKFMQQRQQLLDQEAKKFPS